MTRSYPATRKDPAAGCPTTGPGTVRSANQERGLDATKSDARKRRHGPPRRHSERDWYRALGGGTGERMAVAISSNRALQLGRAHPHFSRQACYTQYQAAKEGRGCATRLRLSLEGIRISCPRAKLERGDLVPRPKMWRSDYER